MNLKKYVSIAFDCDGVILNSNKLKSEAFYHAVLPYGEVLAKRFVDYHAQNGGVSRYKKFDYFLSEMVPPRRRGPKLEELLTSYAAIVRSGLRECEVDPGLYRLRELTSGSRWFVVSGGNQEELRDVFSDRGLDQYFCGGIYGSPDSKDQIFNRLTDDQKLCKPGLFIGDSEYDHAASRRAALDFVFVSHWSEFGGWQSYCQNHSISSYYSLDALTSLGV